VRHAAETGIDLFRVFDSLNYVPNMRVALDAVLSTGALCEAAICYTGDLLDPQRDKYGLKYYVRLARELEKTGVHLLGIKDMAGLCRPYAAAKLVRALKDEIGIPVHFHTHDTSGVAAASVLAASEARVDVVDLALASMSGATSQPNLNSLVAALQHTPRDTGLDLDALNEFSRYWEAVRELYAPFDSSPRTGSAEVYLHEMPGGQYTNLIEQARAMGLGHRWPEIMRTYAEVNRLFGDIVKVTPSSKVVGDMTLFLTSRGIKPPSSTCSPADSASRRVAGPSNSRRSYSANVGRCAAAPERTCRPSISIRKRQPSGRNIRRRSPTPTSTATSCTRRCTRSLPDSSAHTRR
jgi:pyruvate carboxylase